MNAKGLRIILGVLCITAFLAIMFTPVLNITGVTSLSLCDLITVNKAAGSLGMGGGLLSGLAGGASAMFDGITIFAVVGFIAAMLMLCTSYLALIFPVDKKFAGIAGIVSGCIAVGAAIFAFVLANKASSGIAGLVSAGWGAFVIILLGVGAVVLAAILLGVKERKSAYSTPSHRSSASPTSRKGYVPASPATELTPNSRYPARTPYAETVAASMGYQAAPVQPSSPRTEWTGAAQNAAPSTARITPAVRRSPVYIEGIGGAYAGARFDVSDGINVTFGRDPSMCQIVFDRTETLISRQHCSVAYVPSADMFEVRDMSRNGTYIDGLTKKLPTNERQLLPRGTVIHIGSSGNSFKLG